ncbi:MAG: hydroxymethylbutenyl pyrophosphate reductase [Frankiales bacterium]|nr:hydroxymethylbutenyl pyrophosphate reductase [Frankiales bacterium]
MSGEHLVLTALRSEYAALSGQLCDAQLLRTGMGPRRSEAALPVITEAMPRSVLVAGVGGGLDPSVAPGDVVVATEVRDADGTVPLPSAQLLASLIADAGFVVRTGAVYTAPGIVDGPGRDELAGTGALAVDTESAILIRHARSLLYAGRGAPALAVVRVVVDTAAKPLRRATTIANGFTALRTLRKLAPVLDAWSRLIRTRTIELAGPRSFCAGVDRAIDIVNRALELYPMPIYVRRQIVHNAHVVADLEGRGAIFVEELNEVPDGATVIFSAHGVAPAVRLEAERRQLTAIDATCPLVAKVHTEARRFASRGDTVVLIGHPGHDETEGTLGEAPGQILLVENSAQARTLDVADPEHVSYVTQTTLAVDEAETVATALRERFPQIEAPASEDICYATSNRQNAVRAVAADADVVFVIGSTNSSNSLRLVEVAQRAGAEAYLVEDASAIEPAMLGRSAKIGVTAGASAPPGLVDEVVDLLIALGGAQVRERSVTEENLTFTLPKEVGG